MCQCDNDLCPYNDQDGYCEDENLYYECEDQFCTADKGEYL